MGTATAATGHLPEHVPERVPSPPPPAGAETDTGTETDGALAELLELRDILFRLGVGGAAAWQKLEMTGPQLKLLMVLAAVGEQPMGQLARCLGIGLPAATNLVDRLVEAGLATREHSPLDRRVVLVRPSPAGEAQVARLREVNREHLRRILELVPPADLPALVQGTRVLLEAGRRAIASGAGPGGAAPGRGAEDAVDEGSR